MLHNAILFWFFVNIIFIALMSWRYFLKTTDTIDLFILFGSFFMTIVTILALAGVVYCSWFLFTLEG